MRMTRKAPGQALIEFALVLPLLVLLIFGLFDLGWAIYANNTIANAAREGARLAIVSPTINNDANVKQRVIAAAAGLNLGNSQISIAPAFSSRTINSPITVTVTYTYTPFTPVIGKIVAGNGMLLQATSVMISEGVIPVSP